MSEANETKPIKVLPPVVGDDEEPTQADLDAADAEDDEDEEDDGELVEVSVFSVYLKGAHLPVPAIDVRDHEQLMVEFGHAVKNKEILPFFAFTGDPEEAFLGSALVRIDDVTAIQSLVTEEELKGYLDARAEGLDEEDDDVEESALERVERERIERAERKRAEKAAKKAGTPPAGNKGPKGGKGVRGLT